MRKGLALISIILVSLVIVCIPSTVQASTPAITRVQEPLRVDSTGTSLTVTLSNTPEVGDVIIAEFCYKTTLWGSSFASQTGVTWKQVQAASNGDMNVEIWAGVVTSASASKTVKANLPGSASAAILDVAVYRGLNTNYILNSVPAMDIGANGIGDGTSTSISAVGSGTTYYSTELWLGGAMMLTYGQTSPQNGFILIDGQVTNLISLGYYEQIVSARGQPHLGATGLGSGKWLAIVVCFPAAPTLNLTPASGASGDTVTVSGDNFCYWYSVNAKFDGASIGSFSPDETGHVTGTFTVPSKAPGTYTVSVSDTANSAASTPFLVTILVVTPENPIGVFAPLLAVGLALTVWGTFQRSKGPRKQPLLL
jgi:hypothetical protein